MDDNFRNQRFSRKKFLSLFIILLVLVSIPLTIFTVSQRELTDSRSRANLTSDINTQTKLLFSDSTDAEKIIASQKRKEQMSNLAKTNPDEFLLNALTNDLRNKLPIPAQENIEKRIEIEGIILVEAVDEKSSEENVASFVTFQELDGEGYVKNSYQVYLREDMSPEFTGKIILKGYLLDNILIPITIENSPNVLGISTTGDLKIGVVMVNFKNDYSDVKNDFTRAHLANIYFTAPNSVANYISQTSMENLKATGDINDVYGWIDLPEYTRKQVCDIYEKEPNNRGYIKAINQIAKQEANSRGKNFDDYDIIGYVFPAVNTESKDNAGTNCYWNAITKGIPGDNIVSPVHFLNGDYDGVNDVDHGPLDGSASVRFYSGILAHEVGHSLGLSHAHGMLCGNKQIDSFNNCSIYGYGDRFDLMGGAWDYHPHTNARNKHMMGWLPPENIKTIKTSGEYTLYSSSKIRPANQTQLIKIDRPNDSGSYYLDYKSKHNGDGNSSMPQAAYRGATLRLSDVDLPEMDYFTGGSVNEWRTKQSYLIDVNKEDNSARGGLLDSSFKDDMVFTDSRNRIEIKQINHDTEAVKLSINFTPPPCEQSHPTLKVTEPALSGNPGQKIKYELTLKNNNSESCDTKVFDILNTSLSNWLVQFSQTAITLNSGQSIKFFADVTSPQNANYLSNPFSIIITATNKSNNSFTKNREIRYSIESLSSGITEPITPTSTPIVTKAITNTPTPTKKPANTPTPTSRPTQTPTLTLKPTGTPTPTPKPTETILKFTSIKLHGIGRGGDNTNPNSAGNNNPLTINRNLNVEIYDSSGNLILNQAGTILYSSKKGDFSGDIKLNSSIQPGNYLIKVKTYKYLRKQFEGIVNINPNSVSEVPSITLIAGDSNGDGILSNHDYHIIADCYSDLTPPKNCNDPAKKFSADLSDDGRVDQDDYNLLLRELSVQTGQ